MSEPIDATPPPAPEPAPSGSPEPSEPARESAVNDKKTMLIGLGIVFALLAFGCCCFSGIGWVALSGDDAAEPTTTVEGIALGLSEMDIWEGGSRIGEIEPNGDFWQGGSEVGEIEADGTIWERGSSIGSIESTGKLWLRGSQVGEIEADGDIWIGGSQWGEAEGYSGTAMDRAAVAA